ncbi:MAG: ABC transporter permease [Oscillospiraceae bacterium]|jgi:sodium transport system permease protein|nr:ABC transporter permease [Oscillospiraceae bacterium]
MKSYTGIIFKKELLDIFRDRRSIIMTFLLPVVLYPLMFWFIGSQTAAQIEGPSMTSIVADAASASGLRAIMNDPVFDSANITVTESADPVAALQDGSADVAVVTTGSHLRLVYDPNKSASSMSLSHVAGLLSTYNQAAQMQTLSDLTGLTLMELAELAPVSFEAVSLDVETGEESSGVGMFLSMMLPMIMIILLSVGGMATAVDLFAGEKERRTFEPLLCTGARRTDILAGKLGAVTVMSLLGALASVAGLFAGYLLNPRAMTLGLDDAQGLTLPPLTVLFVLLIIAAMAVFFSGLHILLSTYARTVKEASTYGSFIMIACYVPIFATMQMMGGDFEFWTAFVPVMNVTGCLKMVLAGINDLGYMGVTLGVTAAFVAVVLVLGRYMFKKENIMLRA